MAQIILHTRIEAPKERVFDLSRCIELHQDTTASTRERAVAGVTSGLLGLDEEVTWSAWHLGWRRRLKVRMTRYERPVFFEDSMVEGAFAMMRHEHHFADDGDAMGDAIVDAHPNARALAGREVQFLDHARGP